MEQASTVRYFAHMEDPSVLRRFRSTLDEAYGARIERVVLFGSRARGDAGADSDYDIALFLTGLTDRWAEIERIALIGHGLFEEMGAAINCIPFPAGSWRERTPLMFEIRKDGRDL